ncbi:hypothetical protein [Hymenobacter algoricola]|uniref:Uncharacterized protein n=1 Tax=Hymenobacter algoricola TaxID=486267 RepID=A0ABP7MCH2_9BACT
MTSPTENPTPPADTTQPESLEEAVLDMLHMFDPTTALHELQVLEQDEETPPPAPEQRPAQS